MPAAYFQIQLSVQPKSGGEAALIPPPVLQGLDYRFVIVKDGAEEGIAKLDGPDAALKRVAKDKGCKKLTTKQIKTLRARYPKPKIKTKYRAQPQEAGNKAVDTFQTVRSGFYLIDVPILAESHDEP